MRECSECVAVVVERIEFRRQVDFDVAAVGYFGRCAELQEIVADTVDGLRAGNICECLRCECCEFFECVEWPETVFLGELVVADVRVPEAVVFHAVRCDEVRAETEC